MHDDTDKPKEQLRQEDCDAVDAYLDEVRDWYHKHGLAEDKKANEVAAKLRGEYGDPEMADRWEGLVNKLRAEGKTGSGNHSALTAEVLRLLYRTRNRYGG
jgi:hypothetical protein